MPDFAPALLAGWTGGRWTRQPQGSITGFSADTRQVRPGQMFVALKTDQRDGHQFLHAAAAAGAAAALVSQSDDSLSLPQLVVEKPLESFQVIAREHRRTFPGRVIGVTGSAGKTSTKDLLATLLGERVLATEGNLNNHIGVPLTLTRLDAAEHDYAVIEAGVSAPGEMAPLAEMISPDVAIVTLVAPAHLAGLGGLEGVRREKAGPAGGHARGRNRDLSLRPAPNMPPFAAFPAKHCRWARLRRPSRPPTPRARTAPNLTLGGDIPETGVFKLPRDQRRHGAQRRSGPDRRASPRDAGRRSPAAPCPLAAPRPCGANGGARGTGSSIWISTTRIRPRWRMRWRRLTGWRRRRWRGSFILGGMEELGPEAPRFHEELGRNLPLRARAIRSALGGNAAALSAAGALGGRRPVRGDRHRRLDRGHRPTASRPSAAPSSSRAAAAISWKGSSPALAH